MDEVTQQNAALVEQAAAAAESLEEQARSLVASVAMFDLGNATPASVTHLPGPALRDATPHALPRNKVGVASANRPAAAPPIRRVERAMALDDTDSWSEF
jgi:methyl-accepting chemotaxis protein